MGISFPSISKLPSGVSLGTYEEWTKMGRCFRDALAVEDLSKNDYRTNHISFNSIFDKGNETDKDKIINEAKRDYCKTPHVLFPSPRERDSQGGEQKSSETARLLERGDRDVEMVRADTGANARPADASRRCMLF